MKFQEVLELKPGDIVIWKNAFYKYVDEVCINNRLIHFEFINVETKTPDYVPVNFCKYLQIPETIPEEIGTASDMMELGF
jgi:hypothetical protein